MESRSHGVGNPVSIQPLSRVNGGGSRSGHGRIGGKIELGFQNQGVGADITESISNIPQRARPNLPIMMNFTVQVLWVHQVGVNAAQTMRCFAGV